MSNSRYQLLVVDIDGTLIGSSGEPSERVRAAVRRATASGVHVALCSGRPPASCWPIARALDLRGPHVVFNGALVKDPDAAAPVLTCPLDHVLTRTMVDYCRARNVCLELYTEETHYVERDWRESRLHAESIRVTYEFASFDDLLRRQHHDDLTIVKGQIITSDARTRRVVREFMASASDQLGISIAIPMAPCEGMECVNVVRRGVSKGAAVRALMAFYGLASQSVAAAGDASNDLPVFAEVGFRVAMGNGDDAVKEAADIVVPSVDEDGLAVAIESHLLVE